MTIFIYDKAGAVIGRSKNLRGIIDRFRNNRHLDAQITVTPRNNPLQPAQFGIRWSDGSWAVADFASYEVCVNRATARRFDGATITIHQQQPLPA